MSDLLQVVVVTFVAGGAMLTLVRPYLRRTSAGDARPCPKCSSGAPCGTAAAVQPLTVVRSGERSSR